MLYEIGVFMVTVTKFCGGYAFYALEDAVEVADGIEATLVADLNYRHCTRSKQQSGLTDAHLIDIARNAAVGTLFEEAAQGIGSHVDKFREGLHAYFFMIVTVDIVL